MTEQELANVIWDIKEVIRNYYDDSEVEDVIFLSPCFVVWIVSSKINMRKYSKN